MASAEVTVTLTDAREVRRLVRACMVLDESWLESGAIYPSHLQELHDALCELAAVTRTAPTLCREVQKGAE